MLPEGFCQRMKKLLGDEYGKFAAALEQPSVKAVRVNKGKVSADHLSEICSLGLEPLPYTDVGFIARNTDGIGRTPEHHSGMIYVQDPGAMATVSALDVREGWWVLDACAAPGGKSTQLSALIGDDGFLLANECVPKRAKIIVGNMERLGVKNATVTPPARVKECSENTTRLWRNGARKTWRSVPHVRGKYSTISADS